MVPPLRRPWPQRPPRKPAGVAGPEATPSLPLPSPTPRPSCQPTPPSTWSKLLCALRVRKLTVTSTWPPLSCAVSHHPDLEGGTESSTDRRWTRTHLCRTWSLGRAWESGAPRLPRGARRGFPAEAAPDAELLGRLGSGRRTPGALPAAQEQGGVHPAGLGEARGIPPQNDSRGGDTAPKRVQLKGDGVAAWPSGKHSNPAPSPQVPRGDSARKQRATKVRRLRVPYQPHRASRSFCPSVPARKSPRPVTSQWISRPLQGPEATPLGPNARARTAGWEGRGGGHSDLFGSVSQIGKNLWGGAFSPSDHVNLFQASAARRAQCRFLAEPQQLKMRYWVLKKELSHWPALGLGRHPLWDSRDL